MSTTSLGPRLTVPLQIRQVSAPPTPIPWADRLSLIGVIALALALAVVQYVQFLEVHRQLWYSGTHDRNAHYLFALRLADDVRSGHIGHWLEHVNSARVWSPLQGLLLSPLLIAGGFDDRLAVLPSLLGWALTIVFGFLVTRRIVPGGGNFAGAIAVAFIALSPAHRAFATDVMLESLGAGLSLVVIYLYLVVVQSDGNASGARWLGIALTALFLHKYNYWLLVLLALTAAEAWQHRRFLWQNGQLFLASIDWRRLGLSQLCSVSNYLIAALLGLIAAIYSYGDRPFVWNGREIGVFPPYNFIQIVYWIAFARLIRWWIRTGRAWADGLDSRLCRVIRWHLWPAAWWLALPKHFGPFVWYLTLGNRGEDQTASPLQGLRQYAVEAVADYHVALWCALIALGLLTVCMLTAGRLRRGGIVVVAFFAIAAFLSVMHPNRKARNLHSWIPAAWLCAGAGAAALVYNRWTARRPNLRPWLACAALAGIGYAQLADGIPQAHAGEGGPHTASPSLFDVSDDLWADCGGDQHVLVLSSVSIWPHLQWSFFQRYGTLDRFEDHRFGFGPRGEPNRAAFRDWLQNTSASTVVFIEAKPGPDVVTKWEAISETPLHAELRDVLDQQQRFRLLRRREFPHHGCTVTVWKRD